MVAVLDVTVKKKPIGGKEQANGRLLFFFIRRLPRGPVENGLCR
jgi:hypothetical protein